MTLVDARTEAAEAIDAAAPDKVLFRPAIPTDGVTERGMLDEIARVGLRTASQSRTGTAGPAIVFVTAPARDEHAAIEIRAYTVTRDQANPTTSRGLAVVDIVEGALRKLPGDTLPPLEPQTVPVRLRETEPKSRGGFSVWRTRVLWPPSRWPSTSTDPAATPLASGVQAVREAAGAVAVAELGIDTSDATDVFRRGRTAAEVIEARWRGLLPRCEVDVVIDERYRARMGASRYDDGTREFDANIAQLVLAVTLSVCAASEAAADDAGLRLWQALSRASAVYPGTERTQFRARDYRPSAYDERAGCLVAHARADIEIRVPLSLPRERAVVERIDMETAFAGLD